MCSRPIPRKSPLGLPKPGGPEKGWGSGPSSITTGLKGVCGWDGTRVWRGAQSCSSPTQGQQWFVLDLQFFTWIRLEIRKKYYMTKVGNHWPSFPREAVKDSSLETFQARLNGALI